jgi:iron complex transport system ATP-binding protein
MMPSPSTLTAQNLTLAYDRASIVQDLTLSIPPGQITALVGANGCGKSTLLRALARLMKPRQGTVYLDGKSIRQHPTKLVAQQLGLLSQSPVAPEGMTVKDLVAQGRYPYQTWMQQWSAQDEHSVQRALEITHLQTLGDRPLTTLSGGQRQRAWIAMALAQDPEILLLDEPTTFLDLAYQIEILDLLWEWNRCQHRTVVMVLHDLNQACRYADHLVAIYQGELYDSGSPATVMTEAMVKTVFGLPCRIMSDPIAGTPLCIPMSRIQHST